ncbi:MAG: quinolinate synthase NadA [Candidatus Zhuqueibacterota bacterium]
MLPDEYKIASDAELKKRILTAKEKYGKRLVILGHHYQRDDVIEMANFRGDSYALCINAAEQKQAEFIVFCGVYFMAEAADILSSDSQIVHLPDIHSGCPLANFADLSMVTHAWQELSSVCDVESIVPVTYVNSSAELKAFCGEYDGVVCTSSNARGAMAWAFERGEKAFFFPDQHLGANTANRMGISEGQRIVWDPKKPFGGNDPEKIRQAKIIVWKGHCLVHTAFKVQHIEHFREQYPDGKVIVHPECSESVVNASDASGSTSHIIQYVDQAPAGSVIAVGTEINLVNRLSNSYSNKKIIPLSRSMCANMYKINLNNLCWTLDNLGKVNIVSVPNTVKSDARKALDRMLQIR